MKIENSIQVELETNKTAPDALKKVWQDQLKLCDSCLKKPLNEPLCKGTFLTTVPLKTFYQTKICSKRQVLAMVQEVYKKLPTTLHPTNKDWAMDVTSFPKTQLIDEEDSSLFIETIVSANCYVSVIDFFKEDTSFDALDALVNKIRHKNGILVVRNFEFTSHSTFVVDSLVSALLYRVESEDKLTVVLYKSGLDLRPTTERQIQFKNFLGTL